MSKIIKPFKCNSRWAVLPVMFIFILTVGVMGLSAAETKLDAKQRAEIVKHVGKALDEEYVFPDVGKKMQAHIKKQLKKGAYKKITNPMDMAEALTKDLRDICHDKHLRVRYHVEPPPKRDENAPTDHEGISRRLSYSNFAFEKLKRLDGNIGYLKMNGFMPAEYGGATAVAALNFLAHTDALIIDLRENGGGSPSMIQLMCSYFFEESVHLNSFYIRKGDKTKQFWTQADVRGKRMTDVDIYVLTSKFTFSAAEEFTYNLKHMKRATIVGETTGGGAHPVSYHYIDEVQFGLSIPFGKAVNPVTKTNWEGKGVVPHVEVPGAQAFDKAYELALKKRLEKADKEGKQRLEGDFNMAGYMKMRQGKTKEAIKIFQKNVALFPQSSNVYDSLGEAYMKDGQKESAVENYKKSLELDPKNLNAVRMLKKLQEKE